MRKLPKRLPMGTSYVVESWGSMVRRYVVLPDGRRIDLPPRKAATCTCADEALSIAPHGRTLADLPPLDRQALV